MYTNRTIININPHKLNDHTSAILANLMLSMQNEKALLKNKIYSLPRYDFDILISKIIAINILQNGHVFRGDILSDEPNAQGKIVKQGSFFVRMVDPVAIHNRPDFAHLLNSRPEKTTWEARHATLTYLPDSRNKTILILRQTLVRTPSSENYILTYSLQGAQDPLFSFFSIDPLNLCTNSNRILAGALQKDPNVSVFCRDITDPTTGHHILLKYSLIKDTQNHPGGPIYHVIGSKILGKGGDAQVYPILGSLQYQNSHLELIDHPKLVVKIHDSSTRNNQELFKENLWNEYKYSKDVEHLQMQRPIASKNKFYSLMRHIEGIEALELFHEIAFCKLSTNFRFKVTLALLEAYIQQIYFRRINHLDLKLENVMACLQTTLIPDLRNIFLFDPPRVLFKIIDLAYAKPYNSQIDVMCGSLDYISPEMASNNSGNSSKFKDEKPDVYALGNCLKIFWGFIFFAPIRGFLTPEYMEKTYKELYQGISPNLSLKLFTKITNAINSMNQENPRNRSGILEIFLEFKDIYKQYQRSIPIERPCFGLKNLSGLPFFPSYTSVHANNVNLHTYDPKYGIC